MTDTEQAHTDNPTLRALRRAALPDTMNLAEMNAMAKFLIDRIDDGARAGSVTIIDFHPLTTMSERQAHDDLLALLESTRRIVWYKSAIVPDSTIVKVTHPATFRAHAELLWNLYIGGGDS